MDTHGGRQRLNSVAQPVDQNANEDRNVRASPTPGTHIKNTVGVVVFRSIPSTALSDCFNCKKNGTYFLFVPTAIVF